MRILLWHVHGAWTTAFVQGSHTYLVPVEPERGPWGRGRAQTYPWPESAVEVPLDDLATTEVDVIVLQRPEELAEAERLLRRRPGRDIPAVYVEHNTPKGDVPETRHPMADRDDLTLVHVTHFNDLFWDAGATRRVVIEHGVPQPRARYDGMMPRLAVVTNEPVRRWRVTGTDLFARFSAATRLDVFGTGVEDLPTVTGAALRTYENLPQRVMHSALAHRRAYLHTTRWTSLGLSLLEAMMIGMPVIGLATTETTEAVPPDAGVLSTRVDVLTDAARWLIGDIEAARAMGRRAAVAARHRYNLGRFLTDWDRLLKEVCV